MCRLQGGEAAPGLIVRGAADEVESTLLAGSVVGVKSRALLAQAMLVAFPLIVVGAIIGAFWVVIKLVNVSGLLGNLATEWLLLPLLPLIFIGIREVLKVRTPPLQGPELTRADYPQFWAMIDELAAGAKTDAPARIVLSPEANAGVTQVKGHREMLVGLPLIALMTRRELGAVLAHELGHYAGGDAAALTRTLRWRAFLKAAHDNDAGLMSLFFVWYSRFFDRFSAGVAREAEQKADEFAVAMAGTDAAISSMQRSTEAALVWRELDQSYLNLFKTAEGRASLVEGMQKLDAANRDGVADAAAQFIATQQASPTDSHPLKRERVAAIKATPRTEPTLPVGAAADLFGGSSGLLAPEGGLLVQQWPVIWWDEVFARSVPAVLQHTAHVRTAQFAAAGLIEKPTPGALLEAIAANPALGRAMTPPEASDEQAQTMTVSLIRLLAQAAQSTGPDVVGVGTWVAPPGLRGADGQPVEQVLTAGTSWGELPAIAADLRKTYPWLDEPVDMATLTAPRQGPLAAMAMVRPAWSMTWHDLIIATSGLLMITPGFKLTSRSEHAQRLRGLIAKPMDELIAAEGATWYPIESIERATLKDERYGPALTLRLTNGKRVKILTGPLTEMFDSPIPAIQKVLADKLS